jgi:hypothetical protein
MQMEKDDDKKPGVLRFPEGLELPIDSQTSSEPRTWHVIYRDDVKWAVVKMRERISLAAIFCLTLLMIIYFFRH